MVRNRGGGSTDYALCLQYRGKPTHHLITRTNGEWTINKKPYGNHNSLFSIVEQFYSPVTGWPCQFKRAVACKSSSSSAAAGGSVRDTRSGDAALKRVLARARKEDDEPITDAEKEEMVSLAQLKKWFGPKIGFFLYDDGRDTPESHFAKLDKDNTGVVSLSALLRARKQSIKKRKDSVKGRPLSTAASASDTGSSPTWLHGPMEQDDANALLRDSNPEQGSFLVRGRPGSPDDYVMCLWYVVVEI